MIKRRKYVQVICPKCLAVRKIREECTKRSTYTGYCNKCIVSSRPKSVWKKHSVRLKGVVPVKAVLASARSRAGKPLSIDKRRKISESHKKLVVEGKHHLWKGGISKTNQLERLGINFKLWREKVFERDNFTCQACGSVGVFLHPHHILNFSENGTLRYSVDNGITLCMPCHFKFHHLYGRKNNTFFQVKSFVGASYGN